MTDNETQSKELNFEGAFHRLEEIARKLEDSSTELEASFKLFEEGQKLLKTCHSLLDKAEKRLKVLTEVDGEFQVKEEVID
ncbi:MAG: exodeoxyribonuclease VII small subunit [Calditrichaeota bacterium]|nr:exodeoxyribonuclease VII small subunit [Calditrichota bacterium]